MKPRCIVIAGPNGAGKTTFAREFLPKYAGVIQFVNAHLIAGGLSALRPEVAMLAAGRLFLAELDRLAKARADFAFETTLSGLIYFGRLKRWKAAGYHIEIIFLRCPRPNLPCAASPVASNRADTTFRAPTYCVDLNAAGIILRNITVRLRTRGRCMITQAAHPFPCKQDHENHHTKKRIEATCRCGWTRAAALCASCAQNCPRLWHAHLHLARWKSCGREAVGELEKLCSLDFHSKNVKERFKKLRL